LMSSPSETTLIMLGTATQVSLISASTAAFWQSVTAIGLTITPLLAMIGRMASQQIEQRKSEGEAMPDLQTEGPGSVIIGFGRVGRLVADMLKAHNKRFVAVEADIDTVRAGQRDGYPIIFGDVSRSEFTDRLNLGRADALILTMDDPVLSLRFVRKVRGWVPNLTILARARDATHAAELYAAGVSDAVPETLESSLQLSEAVLVDLGVPMGPVIVSIHEMRDRMRDQIMEEGKLDERPTLRSASLQDQKT